MAGSKAERPRSQCKRCGHSSQWHQQTEASMKNGAVSFHGAPCFFPGCSCKDYLPEPIRAPA